MSAFANTVYNDDRIAKGFTEGYSDILYAQIIDRVKTDGLALLKAESSLFKFQVFGPTPSPC